MNSDAIWTETEESRLQREDEVRMQELKRLFNLMDEQELEQKTLRVKLERALRILSWDDFEDIEVCPGLAELKGQQPIDTIKQHRKWLKALRSAMPYLAKILLATDASLLIRLRSTLDRYAEISYPNLLVMIQPKLQTLNSIKA
ncbi:TPA: hypothetical protein PKT77_003767 [Acinetobacter baumannii]|uniref:hypothetical protein n=1 Tax=Acinetobacter baumannii TaxID=470 RepID=UPI00165F1755|nr:hypothetical protein [Acinetobacter baumannii]MBD0080598.1 hypothetical protein [Acinetobacter baumannii]MBP4313670.1 hypothetical protein [Acinetobacter baumannii]MBP4677390.1 hypothetical protein [Acinetobacter baumannii]MBP5038782.1 hypothetical protein [Acinetobacter baumannii]MCA4088185.1 hypothetical protein [Acinetobacter baumannii]